MSATANEISTYLSNIRGSYMEFGSELSRYQRIGVENLGCVKFSIFVVN